MTEICPKCERDYERVHPEIKFDYAYCKPCQERIIAEVKGYEVKWK